jgi:CubicO group peptidase (beta-lactamase class C family)
LRDVAARVDRLVADGVVPGAALVVADRQGVLTEHYAGFADRDRAIPVAADTVFALASLTKPLVAAAVLVAVEEGSASLDTPISRVIPTAAAGDATLRDLLSHTSGLPESAARQERDATRQGVSWSTLRGVYPAVAPVLARGARRVYSNPAYATAAAVVEAASGMAFASYLAAGVTEPLGMTTTTLGLADADAVAWVHDAGLWLPGVALFNAAAFRRMPLPQSGGWSTARDYTRFLRLVLGQGVVDDVRLLSDTTASAMLTNQGGPLAGGVESFMTWDRADWAIGFELRDAKTPHWTGSALSDQAATHFGASGTLCFVDPAHGVCATMFCNRATYSGWIRRDDAWPAIVADIVA